MRKNRGRKGIKAKMDNSDRVVSIVKKEGGDSQCENQPIINCFNLTKNIEFESLRMHNYIKI